MGGERRTVADKKLVFLFRLSAFEYPFARHVGAMTFTAFWRSCAREAFLFASPCASPVSLPRVFGVGRVLL